MIKVLLLILFRITGNYDLKVCRKYVALFKIFYRGKGKYVSKMKNDHKFNLKLLYEK